MNKEGEVDNRLGPKTEYKPQKVTKDKSIVAVSRIKNSNLSTLICFHNRQFMTVSKAMGVLGLMNVRALENPVSGTWFMGYFFSFLF